MRIPRGLILLFLVAATIGLLSVTTTQAAPRQATASFGTLIKPGWGGAGDAYGINFGAIFILNCAYHKGRFPQLSSEAPLTATRVITAWTIQQPSCANWLLKYPWTGGSPIPDGYQLPH